MMTELLWEHENPAEFLAESRMPEANSPAASCNPVVHFHEHLTLENLPEFLGSSWMFKDITIICNICGCIREEMLGR